MQKEDFISLLDSLCEASILYAKLQFEAGVDALQVFDSWTHHLQEQEFAPYALAYWKRFIEAFPDKPLIFFSRTNSAYPLQIASIGPTSISFDEKVPLQELRTLVPKNIAVQGNFSPVILRDAPADVVFLEALSMAQSVQKENGVIFNLGHGVLPLTPLENVHAFLEGLYDPYAHQLAEGGREQRMASGFPREEKPNFVPRS